MPKRAVKRKLPSPSRRRNSAPVNRTRSKLTPSSRRCDGPVATRTRLKLGSRMVRRHPTQYPTQWFFPKSRNKSKMTDKNTRQTKSKSFRCKSKQIVKKRRRSPMCEPKSEAEPCDSNESLNSYGSFMSRIFGNQNATKKKRKKKAGKKSTRARSKMGRSKSRAAERTMTEIHHKYVRKEQERPPRSVPVDPWGNQENEKIVDPIDTSKPFRLRSRRRSEPDALNDPFISNFWNRQLVQDLRARPVDGRNPVENMNDPELDRDKKIQREIVVIRRRLPKRVKRREKKRQYRDTNYKQAKRSNGRSHDRQTNRRNTLARHRQIQRRNKPAYHRQIQRRNKPAYHRQIKRRNRSTPYRYIQRPQNKTKRQKLYKARRVQRKTTRIFKSKTPNNQNRKSTIGRRSNRNCKRTKKQ